MLGGAIKKRTNNLIILFFSWWYGQGFSSLLIYLRGVAIFLADLFSVELIFRTLFSAWKRDQISYKGLTIQQRFQVLIMNLVSRMVGFLVKSLFFGVYLVFMAGFLVLSIIAVMVWLLLPLLILSLLAIGLLEVMLN